MPTEVDTPSVAYARMAKAWELIDALLGGTAAMVAAGTKYLPKESREEDAAYRARLGRSFLYNGLKDSIDKLSAKPFCKPVTIVGGDLDEQLEPIAKDADKEGTDLTAFAKQLLEDGVAKGQSHILVDYPAIPEFTTYQQQQTEDIRPYFVHVPACDLLAVKSKRVGGRRVITEARIREKKVVPDGDYGEKEVETVRVYREHDWQVFTKEGDQWTAGEVNTHSFDGVPLVTLPIKPKGFMEAEPPLQQLADLNLAHWQSSSDQRNILRFARLPLLFGAGFSEEQQEAGITLGPAALIMSTDANAKLGFVEHSGKAIEAGKQDLTDLELKMELMAMQPLISGPGNPTATGKAIDEAKAHSSIQAWIRALEAALEQAYRFAAKWIDAELPTDFSVDVFSDFGVSLRAAEDIQSLLAMYTAGALSLETFLKEVKRRGLLSDQVDVEDEMDAIETDGPRMLALPPADDGGGGFGGGGDGFGGGGAPKQIPAKPGGADKATGYAA